MSVLFKNKRHQTGEIPDDSLTAGARNQRQDKTWKTMFFMNLSNLISTNSRTNHIIQVIAGQCENNLLAAFEIRTDELAVIQVTEWPNRRIPDTTITF
ncbi:hypothetical protein R2103_12910 [Nitrosomonas sp. Is24]|uniref:hypothetical protein n=1 Tax=Nitrosomonas sp. Is24 TaxID=3080533 RepID=UPI00294B4E45|nr:hypothetical protein [Nitrosomonas sp. Is24]MDV6342669.1 hypothetical protein [Nitrosomonas sp. Is24]